MSIWLSLVISGVFLWVLVRILQSFSAFTARKFLRGAFLLYVGLLIWAFLQTSLRDVCHEAGLFLAGLFSLQVLTLGFLGFRVGVDMLRSRQSRGSEEELLHFGSSTHPLRVVVSGELASPFLWAGFGPRVVFPRGLWEELSRKERELILSHEYSHWRGHDVHWRIFSFLIWVFAAFHPVLWLLCRELRRLDEFVADDWALRSCEAEPRDLVGLFVKLPGLRPSSGELRANLGGFEVARAQRLMKLTAPGTRSPRTRFVALFVSLFCWPWMAVTASAVELQVQVEPLPLVWVSSEIHLGYLNPILALNQSSHQPLCRRLE